MKKKQERLHQKPGARGFLTIAQQCVICSKCCCCLKYGAAVLLKLPHGFARQDGRSQASLFYPCVFPFLSFLFPQQTCRTKPTSCRVSLQLTEPPGPTTQHKTAQDNTSLPPPRGAHLLSDQFDSGRGGAINHSGQLHYTVKSIHRQHQLIK